jgi:(S)-2-hydroxy-acid oxidase
MDGGVRRGTDIFIALALGAECVWVGRPAIWALAYDGQVGVEKMITMLYEDFRRCMALCGCKSVADIDRGCLSRMGVDGVLRRLEPASATSRKDDDGEGIRKKGREAKL